MINPRSEGNAVVHDFFVNIVSSGYKFESSSVSYLCRVPCFSSLQKAVKHHNALEELLASLRVNLLVPQSPAVQNEPATFDDHGEGASQTSSISLQETCMEDEQVQKTWEYLLHRSQRSYAYFSRFR